MKNLHWTKYGVEAEHTKYDEAQGKDKYFRIIDNDIYFSSNKRFAMGLPEFLTCCSKVDELPVQDDNNNTEELIGDDGNYQVYMSRTINHDSGEEEQVEISLRDRGKWYTWIRFTVSDLISILETINKEKASQSNQ